MFLAVQQASFDYRKACWKPVDVPQACFNYHKASWKPVQDCHASFDYCNASWKPVEFQQASFDYHIACWRTVEVHQTRFHYPNASCSGSWYKFLLPWSLLNACGGWWYTFLLPQSLLKACRCSVSTFWFWRLQSQLKACGDSTKLLCWGTVEDWQDAFDGQKAHWMPVDVCQACFDGWKGSRYSIGDRQPCFIHHKVCWTPLWNPFGQSESLLKTCRRSGSQFWQLVSLFWQSQNLLKPCRDLASQFEVEQILLKTCRSWITLLWLPQS